MRNQPNATDIRKLFVNHVQGNTELLKQKSDLDIAKIRKLKEIEQDQAAFLRKYDKYAASDRSKLRRHSLSAGSVLSATDTVRPDSRALGKDVISNDIPYSFSTWNMLTSLDSGVLQENRNDILRSKTPEITPESDCDTNTTVSVLSPPLSKANQRRRNSLAPGLPTLENFTKLTQKSNTEHIQVNKDIRATQKRTEGVSFLPKIVINGSKGSCTQEVHKTVSVESRPKVANAIVIVNGEPDIKPTPDTEVEDDTQSTSSHNTEKLDQFDENLCLQSPRGVGLTTPNRRYMGRRKSVSVLQADVTVAPKEVVMRRRSNSIVSISHVPGQPERSETTGKVTAPAFSPVVRRSERRKSLSVEVLNVMVENSKGAAKLRYISLLAMKKERLLKQESKVADETSDLNTELLNCRYLRIPKKGNED